MTRNDNSWRRRARAAASCVVMALAAQGLAACTGVASTTPWFGAADAAGAPRLREGVWRIAQPDDKPCAVDETRPLETWPDCAMGLVVTSSQIIASRPGDDGRPEHDAFPYVLAAGDPPILQLADASAPASGYIYIWLQPARLDAGGRVVEVRGWRALCGPPALPDGSPAPLYPGLTSSNGDCTAASRDAVRAAAKASQHDDTTDLADIRWLRAGDR